MMRLIKLLIGSQIPPLPTVSAIIIRGKKILVIKLSYLNGLALPGGFLRGKEDLISGLKREISEETGYKITTIKYFNTYSSLSKLGGYPEVNITYTAKVKGKLKSSPEGKPLWIEPETALKQLVYEDNKMALKDNMKSKKWKRY